MADIKSTIEAQKAFYQTGVTRDFKYRIDNLKKLKAALKSNEDILYKKIYEDFKKSEFDTFANELLLIYHEIDLAIHNIRRWGRKRKVKTNLFNLPGSSYLLPEPYGTCLVMGPWNYPYQLCFCPLVSSMAAGNTTVIKPSELPINTSNAIADLLGEVFDPKYVAVIEGGIPESTELLSQKFDKIYFTGSTKVGKIVYSAAAKNLTPVTLELGGKSPVIVSKNCNLDRAVQRIIWGKFLNCGQTCIAPDYIMVHEDVKDEFLEKAKKQIIRNAYAIENQNYPQIINERNFERLLNLIDADKIFYGGQSNREKLFIEPTILYPVTAQDKVMKEEIFGPILPILSYVSLDEAINYIKSNSKALALYIFSNSKEECRLVEQQISFGGGCVNDVLMHIANSNLPFGGVGGSGIGGAHGKYGFDDFSHLKSMIKKGNLFELSVKHSPYSKNKLKWIKRLAKFN